PANHKKRYKAVEEKLHTGDVFQVAEAVRDMTWRQRREGKLTTMGKRMYKEGMNILAGEIAAVQGVAIDLRFAYFLRTYADLNPGCVYAHKSPGTMTYSSQKYDSLRLSHIFPTKRCSKNMGAVPPLRDLIECEHNASAQQSIDAGSKQ
ncbi:MAG: hypothetical protein U9R15_06270, partial [Chloroflexota bacterium]|nr:hypothetical protein [Chloroflexota bacterium]